MTSRLLFQLPIVPAVIRSHSLFHVLHPLFDFAYLRVHFLNQVVLRFRELLDPSRHRVQLFEKRVLSN